MPLNGGAIIDAVASRAMALGVFDLVNQHEPVKAPGKGVTAAFWVEQIGPHVRSSGLATTSADLLLRGRTYAAAFQPNLDIVEPALLEATSLLIGALSANFTLDPALNVRAISLLGEGASPLLARAGYLNQDGRPLRIYDINISIIVNDVWDQGA